MEAEQSCLQTYGRAGHGGGSSSGLPQFICRCCSTTASGKPSCFPWQSLQGLFGMRLCRTHVLRTQDLAQVVPEAPSPSIGARWHRGIHPWNNPVLVMGSRARWMEAAQLGCICTRLGWRPGEVSENFCSHPNPLQLLWWGDLRELFITFPFSCPRKVVALPWLHGMTKSLLEVCCHLSELKPKAPGLYFRLLVEGGSALLYCSP